MRSFVTAKRTVNSVNNVTGLNYTSVNNIFDCDNLKSDDPKVIVD